MVVKEDVLRVSMSVLFLLSLLGSDSKSPLAMAPSRFLDKTIAKSARGMSFSDSFSHWSGRDGELVSIFLNVIHFGISALRIRLDLVVVRRMKGLQVAVLRDCIFVDVSTLSTDIFLIVVATRLSDYLSFILPRVTANQ
jgi:hypothetical protein